MSAPTLAAAMESAFRAAPRRTAVVDDAGAWTFAELSRAVHALAARYRRLGIQPGDCIVCQVSNRAEHLVAAYAAFRCGAIHVGIHYDSTPAELCRVVALTEPALVVYEPNKRHSGTPLAAIDLLLTEHPHTRVQVVSEIGGPARGLSMASLLEHSGSAAVTFAQVDVEGRPAPDDIAALFPTSGSTGAPKLPVGLHGRLAASWQRFATGLSFTPDDVHLAHLPLGHGFGLMLATAGLLANGRLILIQDFSPGAILDRITRERATVLHGSAAHFRLLLDRLDPARHDVSSLRIGVASASAFPVELLVAMRETLRMDYMLLYGSSEGVGVATRDPVEYLNGSVGRPEPGSVAILDEGGATLGANVEGEIAFSRESFPVRYWTGRSTPAGDTVDRGWYRTGDLGRLDENGLLYVSGRIKHQINRGGSKIDPVEVEEAIQSLDGVADAAVVPAPHAAFGETVCACIVPRPGKAVTLDDLRANLSGRLSPYKLPERLRVVDHIPRTALGKIDREQLRSELETAGVAH